MNCIKQISEVPPFHSKIQLTNLESCISNINTSILLVKQSDYFYNEQFVIIREITDLCTKIEKDRFIREIKILLKFNNDHLNNVIYYSPNFSFVILEFLPNGDLFEFRIHHEHLFQKYKLKFLNHLIRMLSTLHKDNFIHRDIKPNNIFIDKNFNLILGDFQFTRSTSQNYSIIAGTKVYQAPELYTNKSNYTEKIDIYAFGVTLLFLILPNFTDHFKEIENFSINEENLIDFFEKRFLGENYFKNEIKFEEINGYQDILYLKLIRGCTTFNKDERFDIHKVNTIFKEFLHDNDINLIDLEPDFINGEDSNFDDVLNSSSSISILCKFLNSYKNKDENEMNKYYLELLQMESQSLKILYFFCKKKNIPLDMTLEEIKILLGEKNINERESIPIH